MVEDVVEDKEERGNVVAFFLYLFALSKGTITDNSSSLSSSFDDSFLSVLNFFSAMAFLEFITRVLFVIIAVVHGENVESVGDEYLPPSDSGS